MCFHNDLVSFNFLRTDKVFSDHQNWIGKNCLHENTVKPALPVTSNQRSPSLNGHFKTRPTVYIF